MSTRLFKVNVLSYCSPLVCSFIQEYDSFYQSIDIIEFLRRKLRKLYGHHKQVNCDDVIFEFRAEPPLGKIVAFNEKDLNCIEEIQSMPKIWGKSFFELFVTIEPSDGTETSASGNNESNSPAPDDAQSIREANSRDALMLQFLHEPLATEIMSFMQDTSSNMAKMTSEMSNITSLLRNLSVWASLLSDVQETHKTLKTRATEMSSEELNRLDQTATVLLQRQCDILSKLEEKVSSFAASQAAIKSASQQCEGTSEDVASTGCDDELHGIPCYSSSSTSLLENKEYEYIGQRSDEPKQNITTEDDGSESSFVIMSRLP